MMQSVTVLTSLIAIAHVVPLQGAAQPGLSADTARAASVSAADSMRTVRSARRAQKQFESFRRANLPFRASNGGGSCDGALRVGRLCYWPDNGEPEKEVPEPERIARGRERLLDLLANAARQLPGDEWVNGQRVRYLIDARQSADAVSAAADCRSPSWWCEALRGLALHAAGEYARADSAFGASLAAMPDKQRCDWTDISLFLEGEPAKRYRRLPCAERGAIERRFWWLSQPLYATNGNDARTEFLARRTMARLEEQAPSAFNMSWGSDLEELLIRFGWSTWWTRSHPSSVSLSAMPAIIGHGPTPSFFFHPSERLLLGDPADAKSEDWEPRSKGLVARYAPAYAASFSNLRTQVAAFRRGDSSLVVAAFEQPSDSLFRDAEVEAALALASDDTWPVPVSRRPSAAGGAAPLMAKAPRLPMLVSVEVTAPRTRGVARARFGLRPPGYRREAGAGRLALSDMLLYEPGADVGGSLDGVAPRALGAPRTPAGGRVGVYWEVYGVRPEGEPLSVTVVVERVGVPWHTRAAERLGLASKVTPLQVRWQEVPARDAEFVTRAITVDLASLPPGRYRMHLTALAEDGSAASSERLLELIPAP
jgi:hypothetical protein